MSRTSSTAERADAFERRLPPRPSSVAEARQLVRALLADTHRDDLVETAVLLVSEIVTNALLHAGTPIDVAASMDDEGLKVEVGDGSLHLPVRRHYAATAGTGRGLRLLEEMVDEWGVSRRRHGKTVWFRLSDGTSHHEHHGGQQSGRSRAPRNVVDVELCNMPLLLHAAWREHAETLLREYLLASLDTSGDTDEPWDPIQMHADATDAIALLEEHVPQVDIDLAPDRLMGDATEPRVSARTVHVPVPVRSLEHFQTLNDAIEAAVDMANRGLVLAPPTQPEIRQFRRWMCAEVAAQAAGAAPQPWLVDHTEAVPQLAASDWDNDAVTFASTPRLAADELNRITAVSPAALELLGYDDARDLVDRRIVSIVPERFRQAHVAGFTLYLLVARQPLMGKAVVVPALRADGTEVEVELLVTSQRTGDGRQVFLADLRPV